jgi:hypothetical protein
MIIKNDERKLKKEFAIKVIRENPELNKKDLLLKLMGEFNMSQRYTQEIINVAQFEIKNGIQ